MKATGATAGRFDNSLVLRVFETPKQMIQVVGDTAGRFVDELGDLANRHRMAEQHIDQAFSKHSQSSPLLPRKPIVGPEAMPSIRHKCAGMSRRFHRLLVQWLGGKLS